MPVLELLQSAHFIIEDESHWIQGVSKRMMYDGRICYCSVGALHKATPFKLTDNSLELIKGAIQELELTVDGSIVIYNDTHTHEEVMKVWTKTIKRLKQK